MSQSNAVFKITKTEHYTRSNKRRNAFGSYDTACSHKVTDWGFRVGDKVVRGFDRKRDAQAAMTSYLRSMNETGEVR